MYLTSKETQNILSWHTEDPEEQAEYLVTISAKGQSWKFEKLIAILEWVPPVFNDEGDIIEDGQWCFEPWMSECYDDISVLAWMPLPYMYTETF